MPAVKTEPTTVRASSNTERVLQVLIAICLLVIVWAVYDTFNERVVVVGDTAPDFSITADNGRTLSRSDFGGKLLVLNFWASWCAPCVEEIPSLGAFQQALADQGLVVLGVSVDQNERAYKQFLSRAKIAFTTARDPEARISSDYGTFKFPETYIIDSRGKVVEKVISNRDWMDPEWVARIKRLLVS